jgi:hypothetical protein
MPGQACAGSATGKPAQKKAIEDRLRGLASYAAGRKLGKSCRIHTWHRVLIELLCESWRVSSSSQIAVYHAPKQAYFMTSGLSWAATRNQSNALTMKIRPRRRGIPEDCRSVCRWLEIVPACREFLQLWGESRARVARSKIFALSCQVT